MSNLWINWRILWWRIQIGPDWPWIAIRWHIAVYESSGCIFCDLDLTPEYDSENGVLFHPTGTGIGNVRCGIQS